jgi:peptidoglycan L-alanyl-D-glutamate endopeptidase CwlK
MPNFRLSERSRRNLAGVAPALVAVVKRALEISEVDFVVTEGRRSPERQRELFKAGATRTLNSRHLTGHAIDLAALVGGQVRWDWPLYAKIADAMKRAGREQGTKIVWGGNWRTFRDGPHFELERSDA